MLLSVEVLNVITVVVCFCLKCVSAIESFPGGNMIWCFACFFIAQFPWGNTYSSTVFWMFSFRFRKKFEYEVWLQLFAKWKLESPYLFLFLQPSISFLAKNCQSGHCLFLKISQVPSLLIFGFMYTFDSNRTRHTYYTVHIENPESI